MKGFGRVAGRYVILFTIYVYIDGILIRKQVRNTVWGAIVVTICY